MRLAFAILMLTIPFSATAQQRCYAIIDNVQYCSQGLLLGHAKPAAENVPGPMPNIRAFFSKETEPFSAVIVVVIPVNVPDGAVVTGENIIAIVMQNTDADAFRPGSFKNQRWIEHTTFGRKGAIAEFTGVSASGALRTNYVVDAYLMDDKILAVMTMDDQKTVTKRLRDEHLKTMKNLKVTQ